MCCKLCIGDCKAECHLHHTLGIQRLVQSESVTVTHNATVQTQLIISTHPGTDKWS